MLDFDLQIDFKYYLFSLKTKLSAIVHSEPVRRKAEGTYTPRWQFLENSKPTVCNFIKLFKKKLKYLETYIEYL